MTAHHRTRLLRHTGLAVALPAVLALTAGCAGDPPPDGHQGRIDKVAGVAPSN